MNLLLMLVITKIKKQHTHRVLNTRSSIGLLWLRRKDEKKKTKFEAISKHSPDSTDE